MKFIGSFEKELVTLLPEGSESDLNQIHDQLKGNGTFYEHHDQNRHTMFFGRLYPVRNPAASAGQQYNPAALVHQIIEMKGEAGLKDLDGEFTLFSFTPDSLSIFRDRHGAGPQVYYTDYGFSSHQYLLRSFKDFKPELNLDHLALFLQIGYIPSPDTALKGVSKVPAGFVLHYNKNKIQLKDLYGYEDFGTDQHTIRMDEQEATEEYERLHKKAIRDRVGDAKHVQLLLSGGYDSGGNLSALRSIYDGPVSSYSIGFKDNEWSELPLARILSETFQTEHSDYEITGQEIDHLPEIVREFGDPFNENGVLVNFTAMRLVSEKKGQGIILGGDGNDQHFGTAGKELAMHYRYRMNGIGIGQKLVSAFSGLGLFEKDSLFFKVRFHNEKVLHILESDNFGFRKNQIPKLFRDKPDLTRPAYLSQLPEKIRDFDEFYRVHNYFGDIKQVINEVILFKAARLSGHFGGAMSFPYMSTDLYNFLKTVPRSLKFKGNLKVCASGGGKTKFLHKNYLYPRLPKEITERKKQGGFAPLPIFLQDTDRFDQIKRVILQSDLIKKHMNPAYVQSILERYRMEKDSPGYWFWYRQVRAFQIINLLVAATWYDLIINGQMEDKLGLAE